MMVVMQVDPEGKSDPVLQDLAARAQSALDDLLRYVDVVPPKIPYAKIRTIRTTYVLLREMQP